MKGCGMPVDSNVSRRSAPRLLITGAGGMLGNGLCELALGRWEVHALYRRHEPRVGGLHPVRADLTDPVALRDLFRRVRPRAVIHAAAVSRVDACQARPHETRETNVAAAGQIARLCADLDCDLVFTSTDLVFSGLNAPYREDAAPRPVCEYGRQKAEAEALVLGHCPHALVCRLPLLFGWGPRSETTFFTQMIDALSNGRPLTLFVDEYRTPVDVRSAARGILDLLGRARGRLHLGGRTRVSRFDMGSMVADLLKIEPAAMRPVRIAEMDLPFDRAPDCSLESARAFGMGYDPTPLDLALKEAVFHFKLRARM
jgi:dTDP-4-dehydrorhamnose reductase